MKNNELRSSAPLISIIVPVFNRADEIDEFLSSLSDQTNRNFDVNIIDDGSEDNLKQVVSKYEKQLSISYFHQQNQGPGKARNLGMSKAKGDYFVFIDSDCSFPNNYIENLADHILKNDYDVFGGPDTCRDDFPDFLKAVNFSMTSFIGTGGARGTTGKSVTKYYPRSFNMGIKREVYDKIGGMNELRHGQDMDFSNRIYKAGFKVKYLPDVVVYHKRRTDLRRFFKQIFNWGVARINLGKIDKSMLKPVHSLPAVVLFLFLLTVFFSLFSKMFRKVLLLECAAALFTSIFVLIQSGKKHRSFKVGILSVVTLFTQIIAYGSGFTTGKIKSVFSREKFVKGFTKKYYR